MRDFSRLFTRDKLVTLALWLLLISVAVGILVCFPAFSAGLLLGASVGVCFGKIKTWLLEDSES